MSTERRLPRLRATASGIAGGAVRRTARWSAQSTADLRQLDALVAAALTPELVAGLTDGSSFVDFITRSWQPSALTLTDIAAFGAPVTPAELRFDTLLDSLGESLPPLTVSAAIAIASAADALAARREPFDRPRYATDAAQHAAIASSDPQAGRLLAAIVRFMRCGSVLELGTAYGLSALFLSIELPPDGRIVTIESSEPQLTISAATLADKPQITQLAGTSQDMVDVVAELVAAIDFCFHDGEHSGSAYVRDFDAYAPLMAPGSVLLLDDIHWEDARVSDDAETYQGWLYIAHHARTRRALEIDGSYGLVQLH